MIAHRITFISRLCLAMMYKVGKVSCDTISQARTRGFGLEVMQPKPMWAQLGKSHCEP